MAKLSKKTTELLGLIAKEWAEKAGSLSKSPTAELAIHDSFKVKRLLTELNNGNIQKNYKNRPNSNEECNELQAHLEELKESGEYAFNQLSLNHLHELATSSQQEISAAQSQQETSPAQSQQETSAAQTNRSQKVDASREDLISHRLLSRGTVFPTLAALDARIQETNDPDQTTLTSALTHFLRAFTSDKNTDKNITLNNYLTLAKSYPGSESPTLKSSGYAGYGLGSLATVAFIALGCTMGWAAPVTLALAAFAVVAFACAAAFTVISKPKGLSLDALTLVDSLKTALNDEAKKDETTPS